MRYANVRIMYLMSSAGLCAVLACWAWWGRGRGSSAVHNAPRIPIRFGMVPGLHDRRSTVMATLSALVSGLDAELRRLGYKDSTLVWYRGCWRRLERFFVACGVEEFSLDVAMAWVDEACGFFEKEQAGTLKPTDVYLFRIAQMLGDYAVHGAVLRRYSRSVDKLAGDGAVVVARFQSWLRAA